MKKNYENEMMKIIEKIGEDKKKLLLHSCCAPCSSAIIEFLIGYFDLTIFFYNPNITEEIEYLKRLEEQKEFIVERYPTVSIISGDYSPKNDFFPKISGNEADKEGGERCRKCYLLRLEKTAEVAEDLNFDYFSTVLSISPLKNSEKINLIGEELAEKYSVEYLVADFKKKGRYLRSIELSKENSLYRQDYCGCIFSKIEREKNGDR